MPSSAEGLVHDPTYGNTNQGDECTSVVLLSLPVEPKNDVSSCVKHTA